jgi:aspartyl protease family protein
MSSATKPPGKGLGQAMLVTSFALGLAALTFIFDAWLARESNPNADPRTFENASGVREVVLDRNRQGHYVAGGEINGLPVTFLLDTGATDVAIPQSIAERAGLEPGYAGRAFTANGAVTVYGTEVSRLRIGNIELQDVRASITPSMAGDTILLGMSALQQVEFSQRGSTLTLRQYPEQ